jgi:polygalacturonase
VRNITIRDSYLKGTNLAVRLKTMRGRGGGIEDVLYENLQGSVESAIQITLNYHTTPATNLSATPTSKFAPYLQAPYLLRQPNSTEL